MRLTKERLKEIREAFRVGGFIDNMPEELFAHIDHLESRLAEAEEAIVEYGEARQLLDDTYAAREWEAHETAELRRREASRKLRDIAARVKGEGK